MGRRNALLLWPALLDYSHLAGSGAPHLYWGISSLCVESLPGPLLGLFSYLGKIVLNRFSPSFSILAVAALWVSLEYSRSHLFTGFPWGILGYSFWNVPPLLQTAEWLGVYGVSFFIILFNLNFFFLLKKKIPVIPWAIFVILFASNFFLLSQDLKQSGDKKTIAILQGNIDQYKKWSDAYIQEILITYDALVKEKNVMKSDLILWPESALPGWFPDEFFIAEWVRSVVKNSNRPHLLGSVTDYRQARNAAFLFSSDGKVLAHYDKTHLVPFGEFVPLPSLFGKIAPHLNQLGNFSAGKENKLLELEPLKMGVNICYEAVFPNLVRKQVKNGANLLINITNDGWYLDTAAPLQHFSMNVLRAVENRRYVVRAANTGISGAIDPFGKIAAITELNKKMAILVQVCPIEKKTIYTQRGDLFAAACALLSLTAIVFSLKRKNTHENV